MEATVTFDAVTLADVDDLMGWIAALYREDATENVPESVTRAAVTLLIQEPRYGGAWFIRQGADVVGYVVVCITFSILYGGRDAVLDELYLLPNKRGQGIGTQTIQFAMDYCRKEGIAALHLEVYDDNRAMGLYQRMGFEKRDSRMMTCWLR